MINNIEEFAAELYDRDWRAEDREQLIDEYDLTEEEADEICNALNELDDKYNERFYAVQYGDNYADDFGSEDYETAVQMAEEIANDPDHDGEEIRVCTISVWDDFCIDTEIIREADEE